MSNYPEHDKLREVAKLSQEIGAFLDMGLSDQKLVICEADEDGYYWPTHKPVQAILADYFGIDRYKLDREKQEILRKLNDDTDKVLDALRARHPTTDSG